MKTFYTALMLLLPLLGFSQCLDTVTVVLYPDSFTGDYTTAQQQFNVALSGCGLVGSSSTNYGELVTGPWHGSGHCSCANYGGCTWADQQANMVFDHGIPANSTILNAVLRVEEMNGSTSFVGDLKINGSIIIPGSTTIINENVTGIAQAQYAAQGNTSFWYEVAADQEVEGNTRKNWYSTELPDVTRWPRLTLTYSTTSILVNGSSIASTCTSPYTGTATASATTGTAPYTYLWDSAAGNQTTAAATGLGPGMYTVGVIDANGCTGAATVTVDELPAPTVTVTEATITSCVPGNDGQLQATASGIAPPYTYNWSTGQTGSLISGTGHAGYGVTATDANGCTGTGFIPIYAVNPGGYITSVLATCGQDNGSATAIISGGHTPYTYLWSGSAAGQTSATVTGLAPDSYSLTVTNSLGCTSFKGKTVLAVPALDIVLASTPASCGTTSGSIQTTVSGGTTPYTYAWDASTGSQTTKDASNLGLGVYTLTVTDAAGCTLTADAPVSEIGGNGPATYIAHDGMAHDVEVHYDTDSLGNPNNSILKNGITLKYGYNSFPNDYYISYLNFGQVLAGGTIDSARLTLGGSGHAVRVQALANKFEESTATASNLPPHNSGAGTTNGVLYQGKYTFDVSSQAQYLQNNPGSETSFRIIPGDNSENTSIVISSEHGILNIRPKLVVYYGGAPSVANVSSSPAGCYGGSNSGSATVTVSGGATSTSWQWDANAGSQTTATATGLAVGSYYVTVGTSIGCTAIEKVNVLDASMDIQLSTTDQTIVPANGSIWSGASGGTAPYSYQWSANAGSATAHYVQGLTAGIYTVTATDAAGCWATASDTVHGNCSTCLLPNNLLAFNVQDVSTTLKWEPSCGATGYQIQYKVAGTSNWSTVWKYTNVGSRNLSGLTPATTYKYRIKTICSTQANNSGWSTMKSFTTLAVPCTLPTNLASGPVGGVQAKLTWTAALTAIKYKIRYRAAGGSWTTFQKSGSLSHHWLTGLAYGTTYNWQIRTLCQYGNVTGTPWSAMQSFTTAATPKTAHQLHPDAPTAARKIALMPNPASTQFTVAASGLTGSKAQLRVVDLMGRTVHTETLQLQNGSITRQLPVSNAWGKGLYLVEITDAAGPTVHRLEVLPR